MKRSQTNRAAAIRAAVIFLTWGNFSAATRKFQEEQISEKLAMAKAVNRDAYKQLPVRGDQQYFAVVDPKDPASGKIRRFALRLGCLVRRQPREASVQFRE